MTDKKRLALRGPTLSFTGDPFLLGDAKSYIFEPDALIVIENGIIQRFGPANELLKHLPEECPVTHYPSHSLILPGFIDCHSHYPQSAIIGSYGEKLLDWLKRYTYKAESKFADKSHAKQYAKHFLQSCLQAGTTTAAVFCTVQPQSVEAFFEEADHLNMRMIAGKVMMDRNAPPFLLDTPTSSYDDSKRLIERWHKVHRQHYAITLRFAPTSSHEQLQMAGALWQEYPGTYFHSHLCESQAEAQWVKKLFPQHERYLDVYAHYGLLGAQAIYAHGIWMDESDWQMIHDTGSTIAHCPTSNLFLGSGLFKLDQAKLSSRPINIGMATDIGAGTTFSLLKTLGEAYKVAQIAGQTLTPIQAFYLATRGGAQALGLSNSIGQIATGFEADIVVLDRTASPQMTLCMSRCESINDYLFVLMTLGDESSTLATYIYGDLQYQRTNQ